MRRFKVGTVDTLLTAATLAGGLVLLLNGLHDIYPPLAKLAGGAMLVWLCGYSPMRSKRGAP